MARVALANGERVVATLRKPEALNAFKAEYTPEQLLVLRLDVSKPDEIKAAFATAKATFGRVDVVFNNAGYAVVGELEGMPDELARTMFEVDFWGAAHVSQEAVRFFREENSPRGGRLIQNSAGVGLVTLPIMGLYASAKHGEFAVVVTRTRGATSEKTLTLLLVVWQRSKGLLKPCTRSWILRGTSR